MPHRVALQADGALSQSMATRCHHTKDDAIRVYANSYTLRQHASSSQHGMAWPEERQGYVVESTWMRSVPGYEILCGRSSKKHVEIVTKMISVVRRFIGRQDAGAPGRSHMAQDSFVMICSDTPFPNGLRTRANVYMSFHSTHCSEVLGIQVYVCHASTRHTHT